MTIEVLCTPSILRQQGGARRTSSPRIKGRRFEAAQVQLHRTLRVPRSNDASCTTLPGQRDSTCETHVFISSADICRDCIILKKYEAIITPSSLKLLRFHFGCADVYWLVTIPAGPCVIAGAAHPPEPFSCYSTKFCGPVPRSLIYPPGSLQLLTAKWLSASLPLPQFLS